MNLAVVEDGADTGEGVAEAVARADVAEFVLDVVQNGTHVLDLPRITY